MSNNQFNLHYEAELNEGIKVTTLSPIFCSGDVDAHSFVVKVMRNGKPVNLAGTTVRGFFIRPDNVTITLEGSVNADGEAVVTLSDACYNKQGRFQLVIRVTMAGVISTIFCGIGGMLLTVTDGFIDEDNVIPSLDDLLAQIDVMKEATALALEAADRANEAAENAGSGTVYPVVGYVDADNNIILTSNDLAAGIYTLKYVNVDGTKTDVGNVTVGGTTGGDTATFTNQIPIATNTSGSVVTNGAMYSGYRWNSSGNTTAVDGYFISGLIPAKQGDVLRIRWPGGGEADNLQIRAFASDRTAPYTGYLNFTTIADTTHFLHPTFSAAGCEVDIQNGVLDLTIPVSSAINALPASTAYVTVTLYGDPSDCIVTVNEAVK